MLDLLAYCHEFESFSSGPHYAARLAAATGAALTGLYVAPPLEPVPGGAPHALEAEFLAYVREELDRAQRAHGAFAAWAAHHGARASHWQLALGDASDVIIAAGNRSDLVVLEHRARAPRDSIGTIGKVLLQGTPCIVVPATPACARPAWERIAIAWNGSVEAVRAAHAALPLLRMATQIHLLSAPAAARRVRTACEQEFSIERYLDRHGLAAKTVIFDPSRRSVEEALLAHVTRLDIDLLVMGAFGSTRFHARTPNGIACRVLQQGLLPVFVRH